MGRHIVARGRRLVSLEGDERLLDGGAADHGACGRRPGAVGLRGDHHSFCRGVGFVGWNQSWRASG